MDEENEKALIIEDIVTSKAATFGKHEDNILSLLYDEVTQSLFAGNCTGRIVQYKRSSSNFPFTLIKDYVDLGIGALYSSAQVGRFVLFGGRNYSIAAIDIL